MGVGWGYGANMLTKYLAEVGEKTPLTAATCIDNPFDLEEASRSTPYHITLNEKLTGGLIDILRSNKVDHCFKFCKFLHRITSSFLCLRYASIFIEHSVLIYFIHAK